MEQKRRLKEDILREKVIPPGARIREMPWKQIIVRMRDRVEETGRLLLEKRRPTDVRLQKKLGMMRLALMHQMHAKHGQEVDVAFLLETIELINRMEELLNQYEQDVGEWLDFLSALEKKLEDEGVMDADEELAEQARRLKGAIANLKTKLEDRGPFKPMA